MRRKKYLQQSNHREEKSTIYKNIYCEAAGDYNLYVRGQKLF